MLVAVLILPTFLVDVLTERGPEDELLVALELEVREALQSTGLGF
jgi:hypothetical protein